MFIQVFCHFTTIVQDEELTEGGKSARSDVHLMQKYYQDFYDGYVKTLESAGDNMDR